MKLYSVVFAVIGLVPNLFVAHCPKPVTPLACHGGEALYFSTIKRGGIADRARYDAEYVDLKTRCLTELKIELR